MKKIFLVILFSLFLTLSINAQTSGIGAGIIIGEPTGISGKMWLTNNNAVDAAAAWSFDKGALRIQADYVTHIWDLLSVPSGKLPLYVGIGGHITFAENFGAAVRIPVGLDYMFDKVPLDLFIEGVPGLALAPSTKFYIAGGLGIRYFLN